MSVAEAEVGEAVQARALRGSVDHRGLTLDRTGLVGTLTFIGVLTLAMTCLAIVTAGWWVLALLTLGLLLSLVRPRRGRHGRRWT